MGAAVNLSSRRSAVKPVNAEPKRSDSIVPLAATITEAGKEFLDVQYNVLITIIKDN